MTILCIGDSLTEGDYGSEPEGTKNVHSENYPFYLKKYLQCDVINMGKCGASAKSYYHTMFQKINFETIHPDKVLIMLGTNGGLSDTIEIDCLGGQYQNFADTNTGCYCKIIEETIENTGHNAEIILMTPPHAGIKRMHNRLNAINSNAIVHKVAQRYGLMVLDMLNDSGFTDENQDIMQPIDNLHFGREGYEKMAEFIAKSITSDFVSN